MRLVVSCVVGCALGGCLADDAPRFSDKGQGVWVDGPGTPAVAYRAVWGAHASDVFAVGDGAAHFDGEAWSPYELPAATYRAIWGASADQIWIGGDNILLARTLTGWQQQLVFDRDQPITEFSVLSIVGGYAVIRTGGRLLLVVNQGSAWQTPYWRSGSALPFAVQPTLHVGYSMVFAGDGELHDLRTSTDLGVPLLESLPYFYDGGEGIAVVGGDGGQYVAAGPDHVLFRFDVQEPITVVDDRGRKPHGVSMRNGQAFVVGEQIGLAGARSTSTVGSSPIEACDVDGCALERIEADRGQALQAVWSDGNGHAVAVGDGWIVHRTSCGALRCAVD
jgi:hypothetical protein